MIAAPPPRRGSGGKVGFPRAGASDGPKVPEGSVDPHRGKMFVFNENPWKKLTGFRVGDAPRAVILVGGQQDGFFALNYTEQLTKRMVAEGWSVIQALFGSWYAGYGRAVLENDSEDLDALLRYCVNKFDMTEFALFGFHTGAQDVVFYMQNGDYRSKVSRVILQGGMRNPKEFKEHDPATQEMYRQVAQEMIEMGRGNNLMPEAMHPRPISAFRFLAMECNQGVQDFFNPHLSEDDMAQIVGHIEVPILILFCMDDNFRILHNDKKELEDKIQSAIPGDVSCRWIEGGCDEWLNFLKGFENELTKCVADFIDQEHRKRLEKDEEQRREAEAESKRGRSIVYQKHGLKRSISQSSLSSQFSQSSST
eukprot:TRINITY_DN67836_c7_g6_i1.p1 TRINITY_DN67836_c7_g6~~TRINITY_DN67836_c7_g6_i1.p1  ORF type:complete len:366 (+),score=52.32 TRINITY_DN67836_c7_g6_i1:108-1205(+)